MERRRIPVAAKTAFPIAGATAMMGVSPPPAGGISVLSRRCTSIFGRSRKRGTRYREKVGFRILPFLNSISSRECSSQAHADTTLDLGKEIVRVQNRAAFKYFSHFPDVDLPLGAVDCRFPHRLRRRNSSRCRTPLRPPYRGSSPCCARAQPNRSAADSSTARIRPSLRCASLNSTGSAPAAAASSSMKDSRAKLFPVAARQR